MKVLITGSNRGIGLEFVRQLAERGDRVFATCRTPDRAEALKTLQGQYPDQISIVAMQVSDPESIAASHAEVSALTSGLDLLVNNAAIAIPDGGFGNFDLEKMQSILTINSISPILVAQQYVDLLRAGENPKIINVSSGAGSIEKRKSLGPYSYGASKAALNFYSRNLSLELMDDRITVLAMNPGWVITDMGGPNAHITPEESISSMLNVIDSLTLADTGGFKNYSGETIPW